MKRLLLILLIPFGLLVGWGFHARNRPAEVPFSKAHRETLISTLPTNGRAEPIEWAAARADVAGLVETVPVREGETVAKGGVLATMTATGLAAEIRAAEARVAQARADLALLEAGGKGGELAEIENGLVRGRLDVETARRELSALERLAAKNAATRVEVEAARDRVRQAELAIQALERRRASLVGKTDIQAAQARVREAEAAVSGARERLAQTAVRAPVAGMVYGLAARPGAYLNPGDLVANVGRTERLRVRVWVDEPELGRVRVGQPVTITWDALPGRRWQGTVEREPSEIQALGTRQVGEVWCTIDNPGQDLIPGTNVNAEIRTSVVENAVTIPREALRREAQGVGVYVLRDDVLEWRTVTTGAASATRVQVLKNLAEGDAVALPTERQLQAGMRVRPDYR
ncbi:MAG TPA: efflux RND transporter periplasmic adaptor subunit [Bryobacteraceae bacterium]|nr:efflux RND transporter periplasmic adaptor subunit [Bryobacteraceae bacterium]